MLDSREWGLRRKLEEPSWRIPARRDWLMAEGERQREMAAPKIRAARLVWLRLRLGHHRGPSRGAVPAPGGGGARRGSRAD